MDSKEKEHTSLTAIRRKKKGTKMAFANGPLPRQRALSARMTRHIKGKNRKRERKKGLLTWSMTRITNAWMCESVNGTKEEKKKRS